MLKRIFFVIIIIISLSSVSFAQKGSSKDSVQYLTLDQCLAYALQHQPEVLQSGINITIAHKTNAIALSAWLPQVNLVGSLEHYFELPTAFQTNVLNLKGPLL